MPNMAQSTAPTARRSGVFAAPLFDPARTSAILAEIDRAPGRVRLADLSPQLGLTPKIQNTVIREGLLEVDRLGGRGNPYVISPDEARKLLLAALLAVAAGVALAIMLRGLEGAGVTGKVAAEVLSSTVKT
jgi:hypothetical protein